MEGCNECSRLFFFRSIILVSKMIYINSISGYTAAKFMYLKPPPVSSGVSTDSTTEETGKPVDEARH
jgi:hypothetical protein